MVCFEEHWPIGTENAFRIGPYIAAIEEQGEVIRCNFGNRFPVPQFIKDESRDRSTSTTPLL